MAELNEQQRIAVEARDKHILCLAGAGTGKTFTMLERIKRIIKDGAKPDEILVLTFTNNAAAEMKERFMQGMPEGKLYPQFCTFHAFCYSLIVGDKEIRERLGYYKIPEIATEEQIKQISKLTKEKLHIKLSDAKLSGGVKLQPKEKREYELYHKEYDKRLRADGFITFDEMCYGVCKLFESGSELVKKYNDKYKYIFVDEFQDTDPKQWEFVKAFEGADIFVVGDIKQAIYGFRGADNTIIKSLLEEESGYRVIQLPVNYRSTQQICDVANMIHQPLRYEINNDLQLEALREGAKVEFCMTDEMDEVCDDIVEAIKGGEGKTVAVLTRMNKDVENLKMLLECRGIAVNGENRAEMVEKVWKGVWDYKYAENWLAALLPAEDYDKYIKYRLCNADEEDEAYIEYLANYGDLNEIPVYSYRYQQIMAIRGYISKIKEIKERVEEVENIEGDERLKAQEVKKAFKKIMEVLEVTDEAIEVGSEELERIIEEEPEGLTEMAEVLKGASEKAIEAMENETQEMQVYVGTIHSAKGLEYDEVYLWGVNYSTGEPEETMNILYVGITRAKDKLKIYSREATLGEIIENNIKKRERGIVA